MTKCALQKSRVARPWLETDVGRSRQKHKGRRESGPFIALPKHILESAEWAALTAPEIKLFIDIYGQYNGANNGDLAATWKLMAARGWRSRDTLNRALRGLLDKGFIERTRIGGLNRCSLYAVSFKPIDECRAKLDVAPTRMPSNAWKSKLPTREPCQSGTAVGLVAPRYAMR